MKTRAKALLVLAVMTVLAVVSAHVAAGSNQRLIALKQPRQLASAKSHAWCDKQPTHRTLKQVPVWLHLLVHTDSGALVRVGVSVAPFRLMKHHMHRMRKHEFGAWSGCLTVRLYTKGHVPTQMCAAKVLNIEPTSVNCGQVQNQGSGERFVFISMSAPDPPAKCPADATTGGCTPTQPGNGSSP